MSQYLTLRKSSLGLGDCFKHQGKAQIRCLHFATEQGGKSGLEHFTLTFIGTKPFSLRTEVDAIV